ncbi:hypothetical protein HDE69_003698 [Pedobacter cryoconitis]|uniref:Uncharacterized protein n=1 Tax=Pedobacter cryoconitis TaxID=188932 RepID=A0A7W8YW37_9SPHI|nr:hypothetical protein [Pedobacter cryoconitis]MBB5622620.1 hypothetical protein [Pedobacter cryoconitis]
MKKIICYLCLLLFFCSFKNGDQKAQAAQFHSSKITKTEAGTGTGWPGNIQTGVTFKPYTLCDYNDSFILYANPIAGTSNRKWIARTAQGNIELTEYNSWSVEVPPHTLWVELTVTTSSGQIKGRERIGLTNCLN